ncbi:MAG: hypothetical protein QXF01_02615, partial [Candidatus Micrarchaeaceae archaeon]
MIGIKVKKQNAESIRTYLKVHKLMDKQHKVIRRNDFIYFPVRAGIDDSAIVKTMLAQASKVDMDFPLSSDRISYRSELLKEASTKAYQSMVKSYDVIGDTAIVEGDAKTAKKLAKAIMRVNKNVVRVLR